MPVFGTQTIMLDPDVTETSQTVPNIARVLWQNEQGEECWRLTRLSIGSERPFPPGMRRLLTRTELARSGQPPLVVLGEAGSGMTSFVQWLQKESNSNAKDRVLILSFTDLPTQAEQKPEEFTIWLRHCVGADVPIAAGGNVRPPIQSLLEPLERYAQAQAKDASTIIVFQGLAALKELKLTSKLFASFRRLVEEQRLVRLGLVFLGEDPRLFSAVPFSDFLPVCEVCRTPCLEENDLKQLWNAGAIKPDARDVEQLAKECLDWTGGQPLLCQLFLKYLVDQPTAALADVGPYLRNHPPRAVSFWQERLAELTRESSYVRRMIQAMVDGATFKDIAKELEPLFVAGWIRQKPMGWGIRSQLHEAWAREGFRKGTQQGTPTRRSR